MKDHVRKVNSPLKVPTILGTIKERLVEYRFNIDHYDIKEGSIRARRNSLDKMVLGLYRNIRVLVKKDERSQDISIDLQWGGLISSNIITFLLIFFVAYAFLKGSGWMGFLYSIPFAAAAVMMNLFFFMLLRNRLINLIKRDLVDLERELKRKSRRRKG
ncbi:MAG TPA: hypothetical protein ENK47_00635 [Euryarchaeota archaeon]|nr:MAG: hypothetical protein DRN57_03700 [Thermoplasmata archaeon]HHD15195.1 hypothetical protein [Euryarchaeota archaeon]